jgi:hypothetical protein
VLVAASVLLVTIVVAVAVALDSAGGGGVPAGLARGDGVSNATAIARACVAVPLAEGVAAERGLSVGVGSATSTTRGVGVTVASGVALASAGTVGNDCGVITAWARSCVVFVATRREPTATATTIVTSNTLAATSTSVDLRQASSAASSLAVSSDRSDVRRIGVFLAANSRRLFAHPAPPGHGHSHMMPATS